MGGGRARSGCGLASGVASSGGVNSDQVAGLDRLWRGGGGGGIAEAGSARGREIGRGDLGGFWRKNPDGRDNVGHLNTIRD
ncbi:hypothetical protein NL676_021023 [Syzygium grande]|nr:hypothetical protein NL676_021023 [Syzygium grande]